MSTFRVHYAGSLTAERRQDIGFRVITSKSLSDFWAETELADQHGVYVFTLKRRGPGAAVPFYVGKASRTTFKTETLNNRNRKAFTAALLEGEGTPEMYLVVLQRSRGPINHDAIDALETLLIWVARHRNPALINRRKINSAPSNLMAHFGSNRVVGVLNTGRGNISDIAQEFREVLGLD
jgi:hypothetical protein